MHDIKIEYDDFSFGYRVTSFDDHIDNSQNSKKLKQSKKEHVLLHGVLIDKENLPLISSEDSSLVKTVELDSSERKRDADAAASMMDTYIDKRDAHELLHSRLTKHKNDLLRCEETQFFDINLRKRKCERRKLN